MSLTSSIYELITVGARGGSSGAAQQRTKPLMGGFAFCPCAVRFEKSEIRALGFPMPDDFPEDGFLAKDCRDTVLAYLRKTEIPISRPRSLRQTLIQSRERFSEGETTHRHDWKGARIERLLDSPSTMIWERSIPIDSRACVFGIYSSAKSWLVPKPNLGGMEVIGSTAVDAIREFRRRNLASTMLAIGSLAIGTIGMHIFLLTLQEPSKSPQQSAIETVAPPTDQ